MKLGTPPILYGQPLFQMYLDVRELQEVISWNLFMDTKDALLLGSVGTVLKNMRIIITQSISEKGESF